METEWGKRSDLAEPKVMLPFRCLTFFFELASCYFLIDFIVCLSFQHGISSYIHAKNMLGVQLRDLIEGTKEKKKKDWQNSLRSHLKHFEVWVAKILYIRNSRTVSFLSTKVLMLRVWSHLVTVCTSYTVKETHTHTKTLSTRDCGLVSQNSHHYKKKCHSASPYIRT